MPDEAVPPSSTQVVALKSPLRTFLDLIVVSGLVGCLVAVCIRLQTLEWRVDALEEASRRNLFRPVASKPVTPLLTPDDDVAAESAEDPSYQPLPKDPKDDDPNDPHETGDDGASSPRPEENEEDEADDEEEAAP